MNNFRSPFGGLWTDRADADEQLQSRHGTTDWLRSALRNWIDNGYVVLPGAADPAVCDRFAAQLGAAWRDGHPSQLVVDSQTGQHRPLVAGDVKRLTRAVDTHVHFAPALDLMASSRLVEFLAAIFVAEPLFFQTLMFEVGSEQGLHQDTAFVVVDRPLEMVGVWIALEDVRAGSGELQYVAGSHRLPDYCFGPNRRHYDPSQDSRDVHDRYYPDTKQRCLDAGLVTQKFAARQGDVLVWSADLVHGGSPITDPSLTRRSLVAHACPSTANPHFFSYLTTHRTTLPLPGGQGSYASQFHVLQG